MSYLPPSPYERIINAVCCYNYYTDRKDEQKSKSLKKSVEHHISEWGGNVIYDSNSNLITKVEWNGKTKTITLSDSIAKYYNPEYELVPIFDM